MDSTVELPGASLTEVDEELQLRRLETFIPAVSPQYMPPRHLAPLLERFELACEGIPQRVCCSAPPRHGKTESVLHVPAFGLRRRPGLTFSYSTYGDRLSKRGSRKARALAHAIGLNTSGPVNEWRTPEGGGFLAGGVGGPLTGYGVDIALIDDPVKNRVEAESATYRARLLDWYRDVLRTRIEPGGSVFVFATRWHQDDLIGQLVSEGFTSINLPAIDSLERPLWPERWSLEALRELEEDVGEFTWASLYQGQPRPRGAAVFVGVTLYDPKTPLPVFRAAGGIDSAYSEKKTADRSAWVTMKRVGSKYYVTGAWAGREPAPHFKARLKQEHRTGMRWRWYVATSELGAAHLFAEGDGGIPLHGEVAKADKFIRAIRYAAAWNRGDVLVPEGAPWASEFVAEHASFTGVNDKRDDIVDAAVAAFDEVYGDAPTPRLGEVTRVAPLRDTLM